MTIYRELRKLPNEQHIPFLIEKGYNQADAEDFARSYQVTRAEIKERLENPKFSQSEAFKDIQLRVQRLRELKRK